MESKTALLSKSIVLNDYEKKLFQDLLSIVHKKNLGTTLRVAGGWVRDKVKRSWLITAFIRSWETNAMTLISH